MIRSQQHFPEEWGRFWLKYHRIFEYDRSIDFICNEFMLDVDKIRTAVATFGWSKAIYFACLILLVRHIVTFDQCLILLFVAIAVDFVPRVKSRKPSLRRRKLHDVADKLKADMPR